MTERPERRPVPGPLSPDEAFVVADGHGSFVVPGDRNRRLKELGTSAWLWVLAAVMASPEPRQHGLAWVTLPIVVVIALHFGRRALGWRDAVDLEIMDMDAVRARLGLGRRIEIALNRFFGLMRLSIAVTLLGTTKEALASRIEEGLLAAERATLGLQPDTGATKGRGGGGGDAVTFGGVEEHRLGLRQQEGHVNATGTTWGGYCGRRGETGTSARAGKRA